ncbi:MAG: aquaporin [Candidatus Micrarchaeota archaeon]
MSMKYIAEFFGAFTLALVVLLSLAISPPAATPVLAALTLGLFVYTVGHISGTHINPAVTVGIFTLGKIRLMDAVGYLVAQFLGGAAAYLLAFSVLGLAPIAPGETSAVVFAAEGLGMLLFAFGIASVVYGRAPAGFSGVVVGGSLLLGIVLAVGIGSGGVLNPAVAVALGLLNPAYLGGELAGSILGFQLYRLLSESAAAPAKKK